VTFETVSLILCGLGWVGAARLVYVRRTLPRIFGLLLMSIWLYVSLMLVLFAMQPALEVLLFFGLLPIVVVAYGYRLYDHYSSTAKSKNDHQHPQMTGTED